MARKAIEESVYREAMEKMLDDGSGIDEITATKVQAIVGGQYSRICKIVDAYKLEYTAQLKAEKETPLPDWYSAIVASTLDLLNERLKSEWATIGNEINSLVHLSAKELTQELEQEKLQGVEDKEQISDLETAVENLSDEQDSYLNTIDNLKNEAARLGAIIQESGQLKAELKTDLEKAREENLSLVGQIASVNSQLTFVNSSVDGLTKELEQEKLQGAMDKAQGMNDRTQILNLETKIKSLENEQKINLNTVDNLKNEITKLGVIVQEAGQVKAELKDDLEKTRKENLDLVGQVANIEGQLMVYKSIESK